MSVNVAQTWTQWILSRGMILVEGIEELNEELGTDHSLSRLWEWRTGRRPIPAPIAHYMRLKSLRWALRQSGGRAPKSDAALRALCDRLS